MNDLHEQCCSKSRWYDSWHKFRFVSVLHFVVLVSVGALLTSSITHTITFQTNEQLAAAVAEAVNTDGPGIEFGPWFSMSHWDNCPHLMQQGRVFEVQNSEGQSMMSECTPQLPQGPFDWHSGPARFRLVKEPLPRHSEPHPLPAHMSDEQP